MSITIKKNKFNITTNNISYVFGIDNNGLVRSIYFGNKIEGLDDFDMPIIAEVSTNDPVYELTREEFPVHGNMRYKETCLKVKFFDGTRECVYKYLGYKLKENHLIINLMDEYYPLKIDLHYRALDEFDLIERWVTVKNLGKDSIKIENIYSGQIHIPYEGLNFRNVYGYWGAEQNLFTQKINNGKVIIENRRGISSHNHNPYFILDKNASETSGEVYFGVLKLSGNFKGIVEQTQYGETIVQFGINPYDFSINLKEEEEFEAPIFMVGYTNKGFEDMSHKLHDYANRYLLKSEIRPVLYNSWEATEFKVTCSEQIKLAKIAKELGIELFVVDDGWFGERDSIEKGLGDWYVNKEKFPNGLEELITEVKSLGMKFGIWVEPEMVSKLAKLYLEKPEWIYHYETRISGLSREQYVLNVSKNEVKEFIYNMLDNLLSSYEVDYIKWDANRPISQLGVNEEAWYTHIENVYSIVKNLKKKHPNVLFEACASGGGRIDYGALEAFDDFWTSDNTDALDRLTIQKSYSYIYPIKAMRAWVTDSPNFLSSRNIPLKFRFHSAMMGSLGIGSNIIKLDKYDKNLFKNMINEYKKIREIIQNGKFYRLENLSRNKYRLFQYVKENKSLLFIFLTQSKIGHRPVKVKLRGLIEEAIYEFMYNGNFIKKSGKYLMNYGIDISLKGDYDSLIIKFECNS